MENIIKYKNIVLILIMGFTFVFIGCEEKFSTEDVELYVRDSVVGTVSSTNIMAGDSVTYTDLTINGHPRSWVFEGGVPETSTDSVVTVTYPKGGEYIALLNVKYRDNITNTIELPTVFVEGLPEPDEYQPMFSVSYGVYTEYDKVTPGVALTLKGNKQFVIEEEEDDPYEGETSWAFKTDASSDWAMASIQPESGPVDLSAFATGYYNIALKSTSNGTILLRLQGGAKAIIKFTAEGEEYGFKRDGEWHMLEIPIADFLAAEPALDLTAITDFLVFRSEGDVRSANNYDFYVDNLFFSKGNVKQTFTQSMGFYTENENVSPLVALTLKENKQFVIEDEFDDPYEGQKSLAFKTDGSDSWAMASIQPESGPVDISDFADGFYNVALKSTSNGKILLRLQGGGAKAIIKFTANGEEYGFVRDGEWHWIQIPIAHFVAAEPALDLSAITDFLVFRSEGDVRSANNYDFYLDNFFLSK